MQSEESAQETEDELEQKAPKLTPPNAKNARSKISVQKTKPKSRTAAANVPPPAFPALTSNEPELGPEDMWGDFEDGNAHPATTITVLPNKKPNTRDDADDDVILPEWTDDLPWNERLGALYPPKAIKKGWKVGKLLDAIHEAGLVMPPVGPAFKTKAQYTAYLVEAYNVAYDNADSDEDEDEEQADEEQEEDPVVPLTALKPGPPDSKLKTKSLSSSSSTSSSKDDDDEAAKVIVPANPPHSRSTSKSTKRSRSPGGQFQSYEHFV